MKKEALEQARAAYVIEAQCIEEELAYFDDEAFSRAVDALAKAPRIGAAGCGHSGIICQHFAHLMCCIERPARFISPAEAVHGATGFLQPGDVMVFASRGGKTKELLPILEICKKKRCHCPDGDGKPGFSPGKGRGHCAQAARQPGDGQI